MPSPVPFLYFRKRNGTEVPFDPEKINRAVYRAAEAISRSDGSRVDTGRIQEVTAKVVSYLDDPESEYYVYPNEKGERIPEIEDVQDLVEIVLAEENLSAVVAAYKRYRKIREIARRSIKVRHDGSGHLDPTDASLLLVESITDEVVHPWDKSKIVLQLIRETKLSSELANVVAKSVENRVIAGEFPTVNTALIREMVNNELYDRGLQQQLKDLSIYAVPKDFVETLMFSKSTENSNIVSNNPEAVNLSIAELVLKQWALETVYSADVKRAHDTGAVHVHDLGYPHRVYCSSHSLEYIKKYGLTGLENLNTESKPARSASVLTGHLNTFLASMQANYAGALGIGYVNVFYTPLLVGKSRKELKQIAQELVFNGSQNAFSRGGQTLFLDYNIHTGVPSYLADIPAVGPGGKYMLRLTDGTTKELEETAAGETDPHGNRLMQLSLPDENGGRLVYRETVNPKTGAIKADPKLEKELAEREEAIVTYKEYSKIARNFASALLEVFAEGDRHGKVFEFPKCDFHINEEAFKDPEQNKLLREACELASLNGSTYFVFDRDEVTLSACCRLRTAIEDTYMIKHPESMRFCGFQNVTINLPQAAYRAGRGNFDGFLEEVGSAMDIAIDAHLQKRSFIAKLMSAPHMPLWQIGKQAMDGRPYVDLDKATYIVGLVGLNEALHFLTGEELHETAAALKLGLKTVSYMRFKAKEDGKRLGLKISLEESPAESATRRLAKVDMRTYPEARQYVRGDLERDEYYYTNSIHLRADAPVDIIKRIRLQSKFHTMIDSGAIIHAFVGEELPPPSSILNLVRKTFEQTQAAQMTISPEFTICNDCHSMDVGLRDTCSTCESSNVYGLTRIVGYYSRINNWNKSKIGELRDRRAGNYAVPSAQPAAEPAAREKVTV